MPESPVQNVLFTEKKGQIIMIKCAVILILYTLLQYYYWTSKHI